MAVLQTFGPSIGKQLFWQLLARVNWLFYQVTSCWGREERVVRTCHFHGWRKVDWTVVQVEKVQSIGATISYLGHRVWGVANLTGPVVVGCVATTKTFRLSPELQLLELPAGCGVETAEWAIPATLHGNRAAVIEPVRHPINKQVTKFTTRESQKSRKRRFPTEQSSVFHLFWSPLTSILHAHGFS